MLEGMLELNTLVPPQLPRCRPLTCVRGSERGLQSTAVHVFMLESGLFLKKPSRATNAGMDRGSFGGGRDKGADGAKEARGDGQVRTGTLFRPY